jgi:hypothetical protein
MFAIEKLRLIERKRAVVTAKLAHANDNRRIERHAPATPGRTALIGRWRRSEQTGRLELHWSLEAVQEETEAPRSSPRTLREGHTYNLVHATCGANRQNCHPTDTQLNVVGLSAKATLIFARN